MIPLLLLLAGGVDVKASPSVGMNRVTSTISVKIDHPTAEMYCPTVEVIWPDGTKSTQESDCEPFCPCSPEPFEWHTTRRFGQGEWEIRVRLIQGKKVIQRLIKVRVI